MNTVTQYKLKGSNDKIYVKELDQGIKVYVMKKDLDTVDINLIVKYGNEDTRYKDPLNLVSRYVRRGIAKELQEEFIDDNAKNIFKKLNSKTYLTVKDYYSKYLVHVNSNKYINPLRKLVKEIFKHKKDNEFSYDLDEAYQIYYTPNNMEIIICGDVVPGEVFAEVEKIFDKLKIKKEPRVIRERLEK